MLKRASIIILTTIMIAVPCVASLTIMEGFPTYLTEVEIQCYPKYIVNITINNETDILIITTNFNITGNFTHIYHFSNKYTMNLNYLDGQNITYVLYINKGQLVLGNVSIKSIYIGHISN
ncbi:hypothetical protein, partial [Acidianus sp. RZ1]